MLEEIVVDRFCHTFILCIFKQNYKKYKVRWILWLVDIMALLLSLLWLLFEPGFEPLLSFILCIGGLITLLLTKSKKNSSVVMKQKAGDNSKQYQSNRDININER